ncbi:MAG: 5-formyltetrahydrofolate cyclo-ligase [Ruthenibacterium sp.]
MTPNKTDEKRILRTTIKAQIAAYPAEENRRVSAKIAENLYRLEAYKAAKTLFCYVGTSREIDTMPILKDALARGKTVCVPRCTAKGEMLAKQISSVDALAVGAYGILSPDANAPTVPPTEIDLALVPCMAADAHGNRLGYGGGYYDRYLPQLCTATVICMCREAFLLQAVPHEFHDAAMQAVLTETAFYRQNK